MKIYNVQKKSLQRGFTLIEVLIVIGIIAILAAIVLVAINPARQFRQANNTQRESNVNALLNAIGQYTVDHKGDVSELDITTTAGEISNDATGDADICDKLVPSYIPSLPTDPDDTENHGANTDCSDTYHTSYNVIKDDNGRITVSAPLAKDPDTGDVDANLISVTR